MPFSVRTNLLSVLLNGVNHIISRIIGIFMPDEVAYSASFDHLQEYIDSFELRGHTTEETITNLLSHLSDHELNFQSRFFRNELISTSAVVLNGLSRIKDPAGLLEKLGKSFERRGFCIYTNTVINAFNRLYGDAMKRRRNETDLDWKRRCQQTLEVWSRFKNPLTKAYCGRFVPLNELKGLLVHSDSDVRRAALRSFVSRRDVSFDEASRLIRSIKKNSFHETGGVVRSLVRRKEATIPQLELLLSSPNVNTRYEAARALASRKDYPDVAVQALQRSAHDTIVEGAEAGLEIRRGKVRFSFDAKIQDSRYALKGIHGKRKMRTAEIMKRTAPLRKPR